MLRCGAASGGDLGSSNAVCKVKRARPPSAAVTAKFDVRAPRLEPGDSSGAMTARPQRRASSNTVEKCSATQAA